MGEYKKSHASAEGVIAPQARHLIACVPFRRNSEIDIQIFPSEDIARMPIEVFRKFCEEGLEICDAHTTGDEDDNQD